MVPVFRVVCTHVYIRFPDKFLYFIPYVYRVGEVCEQKTCLYFLNTGYGMWYIHTIFVPGY